MAFYAGQLIKNPAESRDTLSNASFIRFTGTLI